MQDFRVPCPSFRRTPVGRGRRLRSSSPTVWNEIARRVSQSGAADRLRPARGCDLWMYDTMFVSSSRVTMGQSFCLRVARRSPSNELLQTLRRYLTSLCQLPEETRTLIFVCRRLPDALSVDQRFHFLRRLLPRQRAGAGLLFVGLTSVLRTWFGPPSPPILPQPATDFAPRLTATVSLLVWQPIPCRTAGEPLPRPPGQRRPGVAVRRCRFRPAARPRLHLRRAGRTAGERRRRQAGRVPVRPRRQDHGRLRHPRGRGAAGARMSRTSPASSTTPPCSTITC